jgi:hypothetical protein
MVARLHAASRIAVLAAMVFTLAGCLSAKTGLDVHPDDTVSGQLLVYAPVSELATNGRTKEAGFAAYRKSVPPLPKGTEVPYDDGTNYGVQITYTDTPLAEFSGNLKISHTGNRYTFTIGLDPKALAASVADGDANSAAILIKATSLEISVSLPGSVVKGETNGTVVGQNTVTWNLPANADKPTELKAVSEVTAVAPPTGTGGGGSGTPWLLVIGVVVVLLLVAAVVVLLLLLRRKGSSAAPPQA